VWVLWAVWICFIQTRCNYYAKIEWDLLNCSECFHTLPVQRRDLSPQEPERHAEALSLNWRWQLSQIWWEADGLDDIRTDELRHEHTHTHTHSAGSGNPSAGTLPWANKIKMYTFFFCFNGNTMCETAWTDGSYFWTHLDLNKRPVQSVQVYFCPTSI